MKHFKQPSRQLRYLMNLSPRGNETGEVINEPRAVTVSHEPDKSKGQFSQASL